MDVVSTPVALAVTGLGVAQPPTAHGPNTPVHPSAAGVLQRLPRDPASAADLQPVRLSCLSETITVQAEP